MIGNWAWDWPEIIRKLIKKWGQYDKRVAFHKHQQIAWKKFERCLQLLELIPQPSKKDPDEAWALASYLIQVNARLDEILRQLSKLLLNHADPKPLKKLMKKLRKDAARHGRPNVSPEPSKGGKRKSKKSKEATKKTKKASKRKSKAK